MNDLCIITVHLTWWVITSKVNGVGDYRENKLGKFYLHVYKIVYYLDFKSLTRVQQTRSTIGYRNTHTKIEENKIP